MAEYFDPGFRPHIGEFIEYSHHWSKTFSEWDINEESVPIPTTHPAKTAAWCGSRFSNFGETPVIAVAKPNEPSPDEPELELRWYAGALHEQQLHSDDVLRVIAESAQFPSNDGSNAIILARNLMDPDMHTKIRRRSDRPRPEALATAKKSRLARVVGALSFHGAIYR